jgi:hypothetical protein
MGGPGDGGGGGLLSICQIRQMESRPRRVLPPPEKKKTVGAGDGPSYGRARLKDVPLRRAPPPIRSNKKYSSEHFFCFLPVAQNIPIFLLFLSLIYFLLLESASTSVVGRRRERIGSSGTVKVGQGAARNS